MDKVYNKGVLNMNYWLFKSEPNSWSWEDQLNKGEIGEPWDGVRNYQASNNMKSMRLKDLGFFLSFSYRKENCRYC